MRPTQGERHNTWTLHIQALVLSSRPLFPIKLCASSDSVTVTAALLD